jgi:hypothetical protein
MNMQMFSATCIVAGLTMGGLMGCGAVGAPIPPENVGVNLTIERQKKLEALEEKQHEAAAEVESTEPEPDSVLQGQDVNPPPLQPVGTR